MTAKPLFVSPLSAAVGAQVEGIDLRRPYGEDTAESLRKALAEYGVLCFHAQDIDSDDQIRFASIFGSADADMGRSAEVRNGGYRSEKRGIMFISNLKENDKPLGELSDGELHFHSDGSHRTDPYRATTLYAIKVPSIGGETKFANLGAAYDALPDATKARIDNLKARHVYDRRSTRREDVKVGDEGLTSAVHPLVRVHPDTGRRSLYVSRLMTRDVIGMDPAEGDALIEDLCAHAEKPEFVYAHHWTPRDLLIWDNRAVNHARNDFPANQERHLRRVTVSEPRN